MLQLVITVALPDGPRADIAVTAAPVVRTRRFLASVGEHLNLHLPDGCEWAARCERTGDLLDNVAPVAKAGLRSGDVITVGTRPSSATPTGPIDVSAARVLVIGGPLAGESFILPFGRHQVGRGRANDLVLGDPSVSRHHLDLLVGPTIELEDAGSTNGTVVNGETMRGRLVIEAGTTVEAGDTVFRVEAIGATADSPDAQGVVAFNRPPRVDQPYTGRSFTVPAPPNDPPKARLPLVSALVPFGLGLVMYAVTRSPIALVFPFMSPMMAIGTYYENKRNGSKEFAAAAGKYRARMADLVAELHDARRHELVTRRRQSPAPAEVHERARSLHPALYERSPGEADFLALRIGLADLPSLVTVDRQDGGSELLRLEVDEQIDGFGLAPSVPAIVPLDAVGGLGVAGPPAAALDLGRWIVAAAAALHSPRDLNVVGFVGEDRFAEWEWLKWLPHTRSVTSPLTGAHLAATEGGADRLLDALLDVLRTRAAGGARPPSAPPPTPALLVVLDGSVPIDRPALTQLLTEGPGQGIHFLWVGADPAQVPHPCGAVAEVAPDGRSVCIGFATDGTTIERVTFEGLSRADAATFAHDLAPVVDNLVPLSRDAGLPPSTALVDLLGGKVILEDPGVVQRRWPLGVQLRAPIGVTAKGELSLDLRSDGPHGLVAGTTGSGKSELLQSLVVSLAASHPPSKIAFVLVDYKGGAAFKECKDLPHTVGFVTDLNEHLVRRALVSLNAEVTRREHLLGAANAKDLPDMERKRAPFTPPNLLIVVDEFATLAKEVPEFVGGVVDLAQRGRSLGMHLLLATQRPAGVVTDNIRANTHLRVALRVADESESKDVIAVASAAGIGAAAPGRAFARVGRQEPVPFQSGYVGGRSLMQPTGPDLTIADFDFEEVAVTDQSRDAEPDQLGPTDLEALVARINEAAVLSGIPKPASPWLDPLPEVLDLADLPDSSSDRFAVVGLVDLPSEQRQEPYLVDLDRDGSLLVFGTGGAGKTVLLRTLVASMARTASPDELQFYALDFASRGLASLVALPHVGAVLSAEDDERVPRLFRNLRQRIDTRRRLFAEAGATSLTELRRLRPDSPERERIVVVLDGYAGFGAMYEKLSGGDLIEQLPRLLADGRSVGVHFVITADRRSVLPSVLVGAISRRVVLRLSSKDEYSHIGVNNRHVDLDAPAGRALIDGVELQVALLGDDPSGDGQQAALDAFCRAATVRAAGRRAPGVGVLPDLVASAALPPPVSSLVALFGLGDLDLTAHGLDLREGHALVAGPLRSGRSTALAAIARSLAAAPRPPELHLCGPRRRHLVDVAPWTSCAIGDVDAVVALNALLARVEGAVPAEGVVVLLDDVLDFADRELHELLLRLVKLGRDEAVRLVVAAESAAVRRLYDGPLVEIRKDKTGLLLQPDLDQDGDLLGVKLPRRGTFRFPPGRGFLVRRGQRELFQVAHVDLAGNPERF